MNPLNKLTTILVITAMGCAITISAAWGQGSLTREISSARAALAASPTSIVTRIRLIVLHNEQGNQQLKAGNPDGAISAYLDAMDVAEESGGAISNRHPMVQDSRYNLAFTRIELGDAEQGIADLEALTIDDPNNFDARFLLGLTLIRNPGKGNFNRGMEVLRVMALESSGADRTRAAHTAMRYGYNRSSIEEAMGDAQAALDILAPLRAEYGADGAATKQENDAILYALGVYALGVGNSSEAMAAMEEVGSSNPGFKLNNGVKLNDILAGVYYQVGVEFLGERTEEGGRNALDMFESAEFLEGQDATDIHHGKALAYYRVNDSEGTSKELAIIAERNPVEFKKIVSQ